MSKILTIHLNDMAKELKITEDQIRRRSMKRKHKQMIIIWVGLLAGLLIFRGGWMTYAGLLIFLLDLGLVWWLLRCPHCGKSVRELRPDKTCPYCGKKVE